jgi:EVE domain
MTYRLDLFTPYTWTRFQEHGASVSGFRPRQRHTAFERVKAGDLFLCYLVKLSRWCGVLEVTSAAYEDGTPIFAEENDPFPIRFKVAPKVMLDFEHSIPIEELWDRLSFTRDLQRGSFGWAQAAKLRQSLIRIADEDGQIIASALLEQARTKRAFQLDAADRRHIVQRTVVRTEKGEVEVEVPDREEEQPTNETQIEVRASLKVQAKVVQLGATLGFNIWVPPSDRGKIAELLPATYHAKLVTTLPLNYDLATIKTIENIDVIWLQRRAIAHAFEVEHTTAIYSGLLRMADLLAMQPRMNISLHIVAPIERRDQVRREIVRPVFSVLEGGAMAQRCSFLSYEAVDEILEQPNLPHLRETIIEDYEEYFDAT